TLPPTIHFESLNEHVPLAGGPFYINTTLRPWTVAAGQVRRAAVSSFGFSGTNAHLVVEEYPACERQLAAGVVDTPLLFVLSARTAEQLVVCAERLRSF